MSSPPHTSPFRRVKNKQTDPLPFGLQRHEFDAPKGCQNIWVLKPAGKSRGLGNYWMVVFFCCCRVNYLHVFGTVHVFLEWRSNMYGRLESLVNLWNRNTELGKWAMFWDYYFHNRCVLFGRLDVHLHELDIQYTLAWRHCSKDGWLTWLVGSNSIFFSATYFMFLFIAYKKNSVAYHKKNTIPITKSASQGSWFRWPVILLQTICGVKLMGIYTPQN